MQLLRLSVLSLLCCLPPAFAAEPPPETEPLPEPLPALTQGDAELEPEVTIIKRDDETVEEYRVNGQLYMVKITPAKGYPYYLIDTDGDGRLDTRNSNLEPRIMVPTWMILRW
jgi:hypothetical protein